MTNNKLDKTTKNNKQKNFVNLKRTGSSSALAKYKRSHISDGLSSQDKFLRKLYGTKAGRMLLKVLIRPEISICSGWLMDRPVSKIAIRPFIKKNNIDMSKCVKNIDEFESYNDFFKRKITADARITDDTEFGFVSPCDGRLTVYNIYDTASAKFNIKDSQYSLEQLLRDKQLAQRYKGGRLWLFRLCVDDYHRYIYNVDGIQSEVRRIDGVYHTVNPIASEYYKIYKENTREYCLIKTRDAGTIVFMEVGALLVGKIENHFVRRHRVMKGQEKGNFAFGGSTIILLTQKNAVEPFGRILENSARHVETKVIQGELVGYINKKESSQYNI